jgi:hypothetical protein
MAQTIDGVTANFQEGGWYQGRRYLGGQLLPAGQDQPGHTVSAEVNKQSAAAQGVSESKFTSYLTGQTAKSTTPTTKDAVTPYLNEYQDSLFNASSAPETRVQSPEEVKAQLTTGLVKPEPLNRIAEFETLRTAQGVAETEKSLATLKDQITAEQDMLRQQRGIEEGKTVPMGVIQGRISEEERVANIRLDALGRQEARLVDELNTKYNLINTYMNFKGLDYQDAVSAYDTEYKQNLQVYDIIAGQRKEARSAYEYDQNSAKANLQIYANAVTSGNMNYSDLDPTQKLMISKLEVQSGLPVGFISNLQMSAKDRLMGISDDKTQAWMIGNDGNLNIVQTGMRASGVSTTDTKNISQQFIDSATFSSGNNFPDLVKKFANVMTLEEIYQKFMNSELGKKYGSPVENSNEVRLLYRVARGEITPEQARAELQEGVE